MLGTRFQLAHVVFREAFRESLSRVGPAVVLRPGQPNWTLAAAHCTASAVRGTRLHDTQVSHGRVTFSVLRRFCFILIGCVFHPLRSEILHVAH